MESKRGEIFNCTRFVEVRTLLRNLTEKEIELTKKFNDPSLSEEERKAISDELLAIEQQLTANSPFKYD